MIKLANVKLAEVIPPSIAVDAKMRAIADAVDVELNKQPDLIKSIALWAQLNALPSGVLDHLAWQFNVPVWRDSWPQSTKVSVLRTAIRDKSVVGTRGAVERAVESLGSAVEIVEWFEADVPADPYTFEIIIDLNSIPGQADIETQDDLRRAVDAAKPVRSHYRVILSLKLTGLFGMYATGRPAVVSVLRGVSVESFDPLSIFKPGDLGGLWNPSDISTCRQLSAGTGAVVAGDPVGWVQDLTGQNHPMITATSTQRPTWQGGGLVFDGVDDLLVSSLVPSTTPNTWAVVFERLSTSGTVYLLYTAASGTLRLGTRTTDSGIQNYGAAASNSYSVPVITPPDGPKWAIADYSAGVARLFTSSGDASQTIADGDYTAPAANTWRIGRATVPSGIAFRVKFAMVINRLLTPEERSGLTSYLSSIA